MNVYAPLEGPGTVRRYRTPPPPVLGPYRRPSARIISEGLPRSRVNLLSSCGKSIKMLWGISPQESSGRPSRDLRAKSNPAPRIPLFSGVLEHIYMNAREGLPFACLLMCWLSKIRKPPNAGVSSPDHSERGTSADFSKQSGHRPAPVSGLNSQWAILRKRANSSTSLFMRTPTGRPQESQCAYSVQSVSSIIRTPSGLSHPRTHRGPVRCNRRTPPNG